jgi:hypothetical protein
MTNDKSEDYSYYLTTAIFIAITLNHQLNKDRRGKYVEKLNYV